MSRRVAAAALLLALAAPALRAQSLDLDDDDRRVRSGVAIGGTIARMGGFDGTASRTGIVVAGQVVARLTSRLALQPELQYAQKGFTGDFPLGPTPIHVDYRTDWFELPVLARLELGRAGSARVHALAGPALALSIGCEQRSRTGEVEDVDDCSAADAKPRAADVGVTGGLGIELPQSPYALVLGARYTHGLGEAIRGTDARNRTVTLLLGVAF